MVAGKVSLVVEAHFHRGGSEVELAKAVSDARAVLVHEPPAWGVPTMTVDASNGYAPSLDEVEAFIRDATVE